MSHPLEDTHLKLSRADKHLRELQRKIRGFVSRQPSSSARYDDVEQGRHIYRVTVHRQPPRGWAVIVGDVIHNMRSALDHLAWALSRLTTPKPMHDMTFPIFEQSGRRSQTALNHRIKQMPVEAQKIIKELQPYHFGELASVHPLAILNYLSTTDKHQLLVPTGTILNAPIRAIPGSRSWRLNDREIQVELPIDVDPKVYFEPNLTFQIAVYVPAFHDRGGFDIERLHNIGLHIRAVVVPRFTSFFPPP